MKKLIVAILASTFTLAIAHAGSLVSGRGPATFKLQALTQATEVHVTGGKTNQNTTSTNITLLIKGTTAKATFDSTDMLAVIANSFNTNFPAGSKVGMSFGEIVVVDSTGTNVVFTPTGNVISFQFDEPLTALTATEMLKFDNSGDHESGIVNVTSTFTATMTYDDSLQTTGDTTHTKFTFKGLMVVKTMDNIKTGLGKSSIGLQGSGSGTVRGVFTILEGTISTKTASFNAPI